MLLRYAKRGRNGTDAFPGQPTPQLENQIWPQAAGGDMMGHSRAFSERGFRAAGPPKNDDAR
jgi:hypothetical protein